MINKLLILCFCFALGLQPLVAQPPSREDLQKQQQQLLKELADLNNDLQSIKKNKETALGEYAMVKRKIAAREALINNINKDIHLLTETIYQNQIQIYRLKKELDTLKLQYGQSLVFAYKNRGSYDYLNFLFSAQSFNDALKRMTYLKSYRQYRETQAETINKTQVLLQSTMSTLNSNRNEKSAVLENQGSQLKVLEDDKKEKDQVVKQLKSQEKDIAAQIKQREKDKLRLRAAIDAAIKRAIAEAAEKERLARIARQKAAEEERKRQAQLQREARDREIAAAKNNNAAPNNPTIPSRPAKPVDDSQDSKSTDVATTAVPKNNRAYSSFESTPEGLTESLNFEKNRGRLPWPLDGGRIYGQFGRQQIEGTKLIADNDGIFIKTTVGASVKCVAEGEVTAVMDLDQFQAVMVKHGKYFTTYNMLSSVNVKVGDQVKSGTILGKVAADFDGDGQFEFQVLNDRKQFQNPENWLKRR
ncbi:murein hydrolase activator EnvC family protein [Parasediminibacterium sp. JCM 36343]|uniref:murein hydrolase activator EnvC family protein n=1 Tax=Parasediminibacterium sp. JCM 36343 TaxID=3374279 RepID=UPI00397CD5FA